MGSGMAPDGRRLLSVTVCVCKLFGFYASEPARESVSTHMSLLPCPLRAPQQHVCENDIFIPHVGWGVGARGLLVGVLWVRA